MPQVFCDGEHDNICIVQVVLVSVCSLLALFSALRSYLIYRTDPLKAYNYTAIHLTKLTISLICTFTNFILFLYDLLFEEAVSQALLTYSMFMFVNWISATWIYRFEYVKTQCTSWSLRLLWVVIFIVQIVCFSLESYNIRKDNDIESLQILMIICLVECSLLILLDIVYPQREIIRGNASTMDVYESFSSYNTSENSIKENSRDDSDELWGSFQNKITENQEKRRSFYEDQVRMEKQKIHSIEVYDWEIAEVEGKDVLYYCVEIKRGRQGTVISKTRRRYNEFQNMYKTMVKEHTDIEFPTFPPKKLRTKKDPEKIRMRKLAFEEILHFIVNQGLQNHEFEKFLRPQSELEFYGKLKQKKKQESEEVHPELPPKTEQQLETLINLQQRQSFVNEGDITCQVSGYKIVSEFADKYALYNINVEFKGKKYLVYHRFDDFKALRKKLKLKAKEVPKLPGASLLKSKIDEKMLVSRMQKLDAFLKAVVLDHRFVNDIALLTFLQIN